MVGVVAGNTIGLHLTEWVNFLAGFGAILLTFLAGTEIDSSVIRRNFWSSMSIGVVGFFAPYLGVLAYARFVLDWPWPQAQIAGISLSTTSVAVVYAVMVETGFNKTQIGKIILAACFVNDLGTVLALGIVFAHYDLWLAFFGGVTAFVALDAAALRALVLRDGGPSGERARDEVRGPGAARTWRHGDRRGERGRAAGLPGRHGAGAGISCRSRAAAPHAHHCLHDTHALLLPEGGLARGISGRDCFGGANHRLPCHQDGD